MNKAIRLLAAGALLAAGVPLSSMAQTATITINATVNSQCNLSNATVTLTIDPITTATTVAPVSTLGLTCNRNATVSVALNDGSHSIVSPQKRLKRSAVNEYINYNLSRPNLPLAATGNTCPGTLPGTEWTSTTTVDATPMFTASGGPRTIPICVSVPGSQDPSTGSWQDVVTATLTVS